jgi:hypothetical protein
MKNVLSNIAQTSPGLTAGEFERIYRAKHPLGSGLTSDNIRQGFDQYKQLARKIARNAKNRKQ